MPPISPEAETRAEAALADAVARTGCERWTTPTTTSHPPQVRRGALRRAQTGPEQYFAPEVRALV